MKKFIIIYSTIMTILTVASFKMMCKEAKEEPARIMVTAYTVKYANDSMFVFNGDTDEVIGAYKWECGNNKVDEIINRFDEENE